MHNRDKIRTAQQGTELSMTKLSNYNNERTRKLAQLNVEHSIHAKHEDDAVEFSTPPRHEPAK